MTARRSRIKLALCLVALAFIAALLWRPIKQARDVAAVQDSLDRAWEVYWGSNDRPWLLPEIVDANAEHFLNRIFESSRGYGGGTPGPRGRNLDSIYQDRFRSVFRAPIEEITIGYPQGFRGDDLGAALARFPRLRRFALYENYEDVPTEADWTTLCARLRTLTNLEEINLGGNLLTDAAIAPLAGHPGFRTVSISNCRLTTRCAAIFVTMPNLTQLKLEKPLPDNEAEVRDFEFTQKERDTVTAALPSIHVTFSASFP